MDLIQTISTQLGLRTTQVKSAIELFDQGNTIPFIARYRKEATGSLDEEQLRQISTAVTSLRALEERRETILASIELQGKLTPELRAQIMSADNRTALEDIYQPYKPKRRTRASIARDKGLAGLADVFLSQPCFGPPIGKVVSEYLNDQVETQEEALAGARDVVAEIINDNAQVRQQVRDKALKWASLRCEKINTAEDERSVFESYYEFETRIDRVQPYQTLAINRGETEKILRVQLDIAERDWRGAIQSAFKVDRRSPWSEQLEMAIDDAAKRLLLPSIERDVRQHLTETAERHAIAVFANNLSGLLSQPPLAGHTVLAIDPGFRTGCKVAVIDTTGKVIDTDTIYPHQPQQKKAPALATLAGLSSRHNVTIVAIGNGTASRETEALAAELIKLVKESSGRQMAYLMVSEAGASVYSASPLARTELPELDVTLRGAVSIGRRVQDPLAELVKIDPKSIGIGLYQHDVNQTELGEALAATVETIVNRVGVELNTASPSLLTHVSGIGPKIAERIVKHRDDTGPFSSRKQLMDVAGLGPKAFQQAAGFLRITGGNNPLDASAIHPESYSTAESLLKLAGLKPDSSVQEKQAALESLQQKKSSQDLATDLGTGVPTLTDIIEQLLRPGRDPRSDAPAPILRQDVLSMDDLKVGMRLSGTIRNVVDFGAFVDIGVKQDGLLHRSQMKPGTRLGVGDVIEVEILQIEAARGRISLGLPR